MKNLYLIAVLSLFFGLSAFAESGKGPLQVNAPAGWSVKYDGDEGLQFYTLSRPPQEGMVLLMFSRTSSDFRNEKRISDSLDSIAKWFLVEAKKDPLIKSASDGYAKGTFRGDVFFVQYVLFTLAGGNRQVVFMFSDGKETWEGQYSGSSERWVEAITILRGLKKR